MELNARAKAIIAGFLDAGLQGRKLVRREDFVLTFGVGLFSIEYLHAEGYQFVAQIYSGRSVPFQAETREAPGYLTVVDECSYHGESALSSAMSEWLARLDEEIAALPTARRLEELAQRISDIEDAIKDLPNAYLTCEEADVLRRRMDDLQARWTEHMRQAEADQADLDEQISKLHAEMEMLKQVATTTTVRGLARLLAVRVWPYAKSPDTPRQIAAACQTAKALKEGVTAMLDGS